jgi:hypothetical protein
MTDTLKLVEAAVRLALVLWQWITDEAHEQPVSASLVALVTMLDTRPDVRAELVARARVNVALREQLIDLCDAYAEDWPILATTKQEIEHAAG